MELKEVDELELENIDNGANPYVTKEREYKKKSGGGALFALGLVFLLLSLTILIVIFLLLGKDLLTNKKEEVVEEIPEITYTQSQVDTLLFDAVKEAKETTEEETALLFENRLYAAAKEDSGILNILRESHPDEVVYIYGSRYEFYPVYPELKKNTYENRYLVKDETTERITYEVDGEIKSHICIDVSSFQKNIDWDKVKADGVEYVMIRCAFRGYESGKIVDDSMFESHIEGATKAGLKVGVYFFTEAVDEAEAIEEAEHVLEMIAPYKISLPVAIDVEEVSGKARTDNLTSEELSNNCVAFLNRIEEGGYSSMIYSNSKFFIKKLNVQIIEGYEKWFALYNDKIYFPYEISMWQYASDGTVDGISGKVDMNITLNEY